MAGIVPTDGPSPATFAYFIMVHHKPRQFDWLLRAIQDPRDVFLIHVDLKSRLGLKPDRSGIMGSVRASVAELPNARLMRSQFTNWGGWSLSKALLDAIALALSASPTWSHFINLSGQCYPLKPFDAMRAALTEDKNRVHVELRPIAELPADDWHLRWTPMLETPLRAIRLPGRKAEPAGFKVTHKGSQWVILPRAFCEWLMTAPVTAQITQYLSGLLLSDELLIQSLVLNGPWVDRVAPHYGRHIVWPGPKLLTLDDLPTLRASPAWFGRKFDVDQAGDVVAELAASNGFRVGR